MIIGSSVLYTSTTPYDDAQNVHLGKDMYIYTPYMKATIT